MYSILTNPSTEEKCKEARRAYLGLVGLMCTSFLFGCKAQDDVPGITAMPPYSQTLDVTKANSVVEFEVYIPKPSKRNSLSRYDVILEVFEKFPKENWRIPDLSSVHFKVSIHSLDGDLIVEKEIIGNKGTFKHKGYDGLMGGGIGPSRIIKNAMSMQAYLVYDQYLPEGSYRIRCETLNPLPNLAGRLTKVTIQDIHYPK
jgi:hypothetical protein